MSTRIPIPNQRRELARRLNGGIEVALYWNPHDDSTSIEVWQPATEETLIFAVARDRALDAFYHPFSHLAARSRSLPLTLETA
jgi:hypothetical protein